MAVAIKPFRKLQLGQQSAFGTNVAATHQLLGEWSWREMDDRYRAPYPRGINANVGGLGITTRKGVEIDIDGDLSAEEFVWTMNGGVKGGVSGTGPTDGTYTWTWTPELTTFPTESYYTFEQVEGDGTTNHVARECGDAHLDSFEITFGGTDKVGFRRRWVGRASQSSTPTGSLAAQSAQEPLVSALGAVYIDTSWAGLGGTQITGVIRSGRFAYTSPFVPKYTTDARSDKDLTGYHYDRGFNATLDLTAEIDATLATALITAWRSNSGRWVRLKFLGSVTGGGTTQRYVQIDGAYRFVGEPQYDDETRVVSVSMESYYDTTGTKALEFKAVNAMAAHSTA